MEHINVYFRKFDDGEVIALWDDASNAGNMHKMNSYMHLGQHCDADVNLLYELDKANFLEYEDLLNEMQSVGYTVKVLF